MINRCFLRQQNAAKILTDSSYTLWKMPRTVLSDVQKVFCDRFKKQLRCSQAGHVTGCHGNRVGISLPRASRRSVSQVNVQRLSPGSERRWGKRIQHAMFGKKTWSQGQKLVVFRYGESSSFTPLLCVRCHSRNVLKDWIQEDKEDMHIRARVCIPQCLWRIYTP